MPRSPGRRGPAGGSTPCGAAQPLRHGGRARGPVSRSDGARGAAAGLVGRPGRRDRRSPPARHRPRRPEDDGEHRG
ncbi:MAG: hypothetical protein FJX74_13575 [Armatimonadetes bacterium]|nr:hypothetical protein [Armatimonadota bacterium]